MKGILAVMLVIVVLLTVKAVYADNTVDSYTLTEEDERRLMGEYTLGDGPWFLSNAQVKERVSNYRLYLEASKDHAALYENYNYKEISTEEGKEKYLEGFRKYKSSTGSFLKKEEDGRINSIINNKLIKQATFVTNDNCIFTSGDGVTTVRGVLYFKFGEIGGPVTVHGKEVKPGIQYKVDCELWLSGRPDYTEAIQIKVNGYAYISDPTAFALAVPTYSASPTNSKVLVNGKTISFEAYGINGNNYFKLRDLAMAVTATEKQFEVDWDDTQKAINLVTNEAYTPSGSELTISVNPTAKEAKPTTSKIYVNGEEASFTAYTIGGNNYFKLRDIAKVIDFGVAWDGNTNTISIDTSISYTE